MFDCLKGEYEVCEEIGRGRFGTVHRCYSPVTGESFAVKTIDKNLLVDPTDRECLENEPKILQYLTASGVNYLWFNERVPKTNLAPEISYPWFNEEFSKENLIPGISHPWFSEGVAKANLVPEKFNEKVSKANLAPKACHPCFNKGVPKANLTPATSHPNILKLVGVFEDPHHLHIITELCTGGDLYEQVSQGPLPEPTAGAIFRQLLSAVWTCHLAGIAHRDIKPDNILFDSHGNLKLADFGSAAETVEAMSGVVGTPYYVAPEVLMGRKYNEKVDIWSAGVILYVMLAGAPPFYGETPAETFEAVLRANLRFPTSIFRNVSPQAKDLLRKMICKDPSRRFSAEQVLRHPWVTMMSG